MSDEPRTCAVWPMFYFAPEWDFPTQRFPHGVQLVRPGDAAVLSMLEGLKGWCQLWQDLRDSNGPEEFDSTWGNCPVWDQSPLKWDEVELRWFLCVEVDLCDPQDRPVSELGVSFQSELEDDIARTFQATLRLLKGAYFFAPVRLRTRHGLSSPVIEEATLQGDFWQFAVEDPDRSPSVEQFQKGDISQIIAIWNRRAKLRGLTPDAAPGSRRHLSWREAILNGLLFAQMDRDTNRLLETGNLSDYAEVLEELYGIPFTLDQVKAIVDYLRPFKERYS